MPTNLLNVPHYEQERASSCLPACVRMVLAFWQHFTSESKLANLLGTQSFGTPAPNIRRLEQSGFLITYESGALSIIESHLDKNIPSLVFVQTGDLPYWDENTAHVIVAIGMNETTIFVNDPAFKDAPQAIPIDDFLLAWSEFDYRYALIQPE
jgi:ABC-type bacteriocin/lantibiotic exporter with double-glycine peptidase domain